MCIFCKVPPAKTITSVLLKICASDCITIIAAMLHQQDLLSPILLCGTGRSGIKIKHMILSNTSNQVRGMRFGINTYCNRGTILPTRTQPYFHKRRMHTACVSYVIVRYSYSVIFHESRAGCG